MNNMRVLLETLSLIEDEEQATTKTKVVFSFGRLNPPTIGHEVLVNQVIKTANRLSADHYIFLSQTHKPPKDPLPFKTKAAIFKAAFPQANLWESPEKDVKTPYDALSILSEKYEHIVLVVGSDRVAHFRSMDKYALEFGAKSFRVVSAGKRDPDAEGAVGMSASKARALAAAGDFQGFEKSLPPSVSRQMKKQVYDILRREMKIS